MMLTSSPVVVELGSNLPVLLLVLRFRYEWVMQELRPCQPLIGRFVEQTLQEGFELGRHVVRVFHWVLDDQVDQRVDAVGVERWSTNKKFVDDDTE